MIGMLNVGSRAYAARAPRPRGEFAVGVVASGPWATSFPADHRPAGLRYARAASARIEDSLFVRTTLASSLLSSRATRSHALLRLAMCSAGSALNHSRRGIECEPPSSRPPLPRSSPSLRTARKTAAMPSFSTPETPGSSGRSTGFLPPRPLTHQRRWLDEAVDGPLVAVCRARSRRTPMRRDQ